MRTLLTTLMVLSASLLPARTVQGQGVPPALFVEGGQKPQSLRLARISTDVRIFGHVAETTTTMTFANPTDRVLEGDLYFPLPEGGAIGGYALDIEGRMVDGVAVERDFGREVFEKIVRRGIDPGLVEWTKGNNFKTRVFPIPARGSRTIRVSYLSQLVADRGAAAYYLPLNHKQKVDEFSLRVEVVKPESAPRIRQGELSGFRFEKWRDSFVAEAKLADIAPNEDLVIALPDLRRQSVLVEKSDDGQTYFAIHDFPKSPGRVPAKETPRHVVVYWDASGSRGRSDHRREIDLLRACLDGFLPSDVKSRGFTVDLVLFRNRAQPPKRLRWANLNWRNGQGNDALPRELESVQYDGGTRLSALTPWPEATRPDFYLLFSDGLSNFGRQMPERLEAPVYAFSIGSAADHALLRRLAAATGGQYFNLNRIKNAGVLDALGRAPYSFLSAEVAGAEVSGLYPRLPQPVAGQFTLVGKLVGQRAAVTLNYGRGGKVLKKKTCQITAADAARGSLLRRLWAQTKLADLSTFQKRNQPEIVALGKEFGMVTPFTSLIVLDSLEQYVEHEIAPPKSLPEMRREYLKRVDTLEHQRRKQEGDKLAAVVEMWRQRVKWWGTEFKYPKDFKYVPPKDDRNGGNGDPFGGEAPAEGRPAQEPPAEPAPPGPAAGPGRGEDAAGGFGGDDPFGDTEKSQGELLEEADVGRRPGRRRPAIAIKPWDPKTPYLKELEAASPPAAFGVYMKHRAEYGNSPAFFLDCANFFYKKHQLDLALQVLSNIAEMDLENPQLLRVLGHRLGQLRYFELAVLTFEEVLRLRPEEPQSYRDLALALARRADAIGSSDLPSLDPLTELDGEPPEESESSKQSEPQEPKTTRPRGVKHMSAADARSVYRSVRDDYARAIDLLGRVVLGRWDERFTEIELIALEELNALLPRAKAAGVKEIALDRRLVKLLDVDVRIVMTWHADNTDIDLWVIEPSGEQADYSHDRTTIGGLVSEDFTGGYGPEEYMVRRAMPGVYTIKANYYGSSAARLLGAVTVQVAVYTDYGREDQQRQSITVELKDKEETVEIGRIEF